MNYSCEVIRDLILLQQDNLCSSESEKTINEHLKECEQCQKYLNFLRNDFELSKQKNNDEEMRKAHSIKSVKNKLRKKTILTVFLSIFCSLMVCLIIIIFTKEHIADTLGLKKEITSINYYDECFGKDSLNKYGDKLGMDDSIFPEKITDYMNVYEFKFVFENVADPQYLAYLTVEYTDDEYANEVQRLMEKGKDEIIEYYGVEAAPDGYEILAIFADSYYGFVYAITPTDKSNYITYVEIIFCNYFLDLNIKEYIPESYILEGFDADINNSYRKLKLNIY